jgi:CheY-like chemotaxis protein
MKRVLVIDDDEAVRDSFRLALDGTSYGLVTANSGEAGVELALDGEFFDLVFLDLEMPGICGIETLRRLRACGCSAPIFIVTAFAEEFMVELKQAADSGLTFELARKPLDCSEILSTVAAMLDHEPLEAKPLERCCRGSA